MQQRLVGHGVDETVDEAFLEVAAPVVYLVADLLDQLGGDLAQLVGGNARGGEAPVAIGGVMGRSAPTTRC